MPTGTTKARDARLGHPQPPAYRRWLSQQDAADYLGVSVRSIRNYVRSGVITGRRMPGSRLMRLDRLELDAALEPVPAATEDGGRRAS